MRIKPTKQVRRILLSPLPAVTAILCGLVVLDVALLQRPGAAVYVLPALLLAIGVTTMFYLLTEDNNGP